MHVIDSATREKIVGRISECMKTRRSKRSQYVIVWMEDGCWTVVQAATCARPYEEEFNDIRPLKNTIHIIIANGKQVAARGIGTIRVVLKNKTPIRIDSVLFVPELDRRLLSVPVLVERGLNVSFEKGKCESETITEL